MKRRRLRDSATGRQTSVLEGHTNEVIAVCFSPDGRLLASKSWDSTVRLWRADTGGLLSVLAEPSGGEFTFDALAFHPSEPILASLGEFERVIRIWRLDYDKLLGPTPKRRKPRPNLRLIPVLLPGVKRKPKLPALMRTLDCIDLRETGAAHRQQVRNLVAAILDSPGRR